MKRDEDGGAAARENDLNGILTSYRTALLVRFKSLIDLTLYS